MGCPGNQKKEKHIMILILMCRVKAVLTGGVSLLVKKFAINSAFEIRMILEQKENKTFQKIMDRVY
jgi:hypothetical protein